MNMQRYNLNTVCFWLHFLWIFIGFESTCTAVVIRVSNTGYDNSSCLASNARTPCKTIKFALDAVKNSSNTDFIFSIEDQVYYLEERVSITQTSPDKDIILKSNHATGSTIHCMNIFAGFDIGSGLYSANITRNINFVNLEFENCGPHFAATVVIWNSVEINFTNCVFKHNKQAGICGFDSGVVIDGCHFLNNTPNHQTNSTSGGGARFFLRNAISLSIIIRSSNFTLNSVAMNNSTKFRWPCTNLSICNYRNHLGGGLLIMFQENASGCRVVIQDAIFSSNSAKFGGGVYFAASSMTSRNNFSITNSTFLRNMAVEAGGAMFTRWDTASNITAILKNCTVSENQSKRGAGINVFFMNNNENPIDSVLRFDTVLFSNNYGNASTAIRFMKALPYAGRVDVIPELINCTIVGHNIASVAHTNPFTSQRVNVKFKGRNVFARNNGGGAAGFQDCVLNVHGQLVFTNNTGLNGGAVLLESSQIILYPDSELMFLGNEARGVGGAICVWEHIMEELMQWYNPNCFLTYSEVNLPPSEWKTNISFIENGSMVRGAAIYVSSLQRCLWTKEFPHRDFKTALRWSGNIVYKKNYLFTKALSGSAYDITTDTKGFHLPFPKNVKLAPGQTVPLNLHAVDELGHFTLTLAYVFEADNVNRTPKLQLPHGNYVLMPDSSSTVLFSFNAPEKLYNEIQHRKGKNKRTIQIIDYYSSLENRGFFEFELQECRPGFSYSPESKVCECNKQPGILSCDNDGMLYVEEGYWAGITSDGTLVTYICPDKYCNCTRAPGGLRAGCLFDPNNSDGQCSKNREGWLCGKCSGNTSVGLRWSECVDCPKTGWLLLPVGTIAVTLCVLVIWLNPGISSELRGPLFFFQVLPFIFSPTNHLSRYAFFLADLFKFQGLLVYFFKTCIVKGLNNLYAAAFGYTTPVLALSIFLLAYALSANYCLRFNFRRNSMLRSFWLLLVFIYNFLVETSLCILSCPNVGDKHVFLYDGTMDCFHGDHLLMAIIAILVLVFLVIPPPIMVLLLTKGCWKVDPQFANTLRSGLRPECCWWWSVDLWRRVLLVATFRLADVDWRTKKILIIFECVIILAVHNYCHPYLRSRANLAESVYLLVLCTLAIMQIIEDKQALLDVLAKVLLVILVCHTLIVFLCKAAHFFRNRFHCACVGSNRSRRHRGYDELNCSETEQSLSIETQRQRSNLDALSHIRSQGLSSSRPPLTISGSYEESWQHAG